MLTPEQVQFYKDNGYIALSGVLSDAEVRHLQAVTDDFLERSRSVTESDDIFDLEEGHTAAHPRLRRIKRPIKQHPAYEAILHHPGLLEVLQQLVSPAIRHYGLKLNLKNFVRIDNWGGGGVHLFRSDLVEIECAQENGE